MDAPSSPIARERAEVLPSDRDTGATHRDKGIDGWRGIAVSCVVFAHAFSYRFVGLPGFVAHWTERLAGPLAEFGVQIFFVISGFIITSLMLREIARTGSVGIAAFYARRSFRILPPLLVYYAVLLLLAAAGRLELSAAGLASSASFTCNTSIVDCDWWVAHTWSLAVEEQFYLAWPLLFSFVPAERRTAVLTVVLGMLVLGSAVQPPTFHSNFTSFACLTCGALLATSERAKAWCKRSALTLPWLIVGAIVVVAPLTAAARPVSVVLPILIAYLVFAGRAIGWVRTVLSSAPLQAIGLVSYSVYLWQQLFLGPPGLYLAGPFPPLLLAIAAPLSFWAVEKPFIRWGHRLSRRLKARQEARAATALPSALPGRPSTPR